MQPTVQAALLPDLLACVLKREQFSAFLRLFFFFKHFPKRQSRTEKALKMRELVYWNIGRLYSRLQTVLEVYMAFWFMTSRLF